jgi:hypothetical protein
MAATQGVGGTAETRRADFDSASVETNFAHLISWLHRASGLTWEQLGRTFGVSRRSLHHWASGGRMNAHNAENTAKLAALVRDLGLGSPDEVRAALLMSRNGGPSVIEEFRSGISSERADLNPGPFLPGNLLGALHDAGPES